MAEPTSDPTLAAPGAELLRVDGRKISLSAVLQLAEMESLDGQLHVAELGVIDILRGDVIGATATGPRGVAWTGLDAIYELFLDPAASLVLIGSDGASSGPRRPLGAVTSLVIEGCRLADEWAQLSTSSIEATGKVPADVSEAERAVLASLKGAQNPARLAVATRLPRFRLVDLLRRLEGAGAVRRVRAPQMPESLPADDTDALVDAARRFVRAGRLRDALTVLHQAQQNAPDSTIVSQNLRRVERLLEAST